MILFFGKIITSVTSLVVLGIGLTLLFKKDKPRMQKTILYSIPGIFLLQLGTYLLVAQPLLTHQFLGGKMVLIALCFLTPISTLLVLRWGGKEEGKLVNKWKFILSTQWLAGFIFIYLIVNNEFLVLSPNIVENHLIAFERLAQYFFIYLILSNVFALAILESKLRLFPKLNEIRIPIIIFIGIFAFFIIVASQALLIRTLNKWILLFISFGIMLGYLTPVVFRIKTIFSFDKLVDRRETTYSSMIISFAGIYLILIGIVGKLISSLGGNVQTFFSVMAAFVVCLILFFLVTSQMIRKKVREYIKRIFFKGQYDYRTIWSSFSEDISFNLKLDDLLGAIIESITKLLQVNNAVIYLADEGSNRLNPVKKKARMTPMSCFLLATSMN